MSDEEAELDRQLRIEMKRATLARIQSQNDSQPRLAGPTEEQPTPKQAANIALKGAKGFLGWVEKATRPGGPISQARKRAAEAKESRTLK